MRQTLPKSFQFLNITQFLVVFNDNIFKFLIAYLLIDLKGEDQASAILALCGMVFVVPYLLFSFFAGIISDAYGKRKTLLLSKGSEVFIAMIGIVFLYYQNILGLWLTLFLYALQSTFFSPSKLAMVPELVGRKQIIYANSQMTIATYIAIITGSSSTSILLDLSNRNYVFVGAFCFLTSLLGLASSLKITPYKECYSHTIKDRNLMKTIEWFRKTPLAIPALIGESFFLFAGAFVQLNLIPFAMRSLGLSDLVGGYLFFLLALGISLGAYLCAILPSKKHKISYTPLTGIAIAVVFFLLDLFSENLELSCLLLLFLGIFGGFTQVPLSSLLQEKSPNDLRSKVMGVNHFCAFLGILLASGLLYVLQISLELSPDTCFSALGVFSLGMALYLQENFNKKAPAF